MLATTRKAGQGTGTLTMTAMVAGQTGSGSVQVVDTSPTIRDSCQVSVFPALATVGLLQKTPVTIQVTNQKGDPVDGATVTLTHSLEGTLEPAEGTTSGGLLNVVYTSSLATGTCTITAAANGATGSGSVLVNGALMLHVLPTKDSMKNDSTQTIVVLVTDDRGNRLDAVKVGIDSSAGGTFDETLVATEKGFAYFKYTAPSAPAVTDILTLTCLGRKSAATITLEP